MTEAHEPRPVLEKPGAGLPFFEWLSLRAVAPFIGAHSDWEENWSLLDKSNAKIFSMIESLDDEQLGQPVLVPRIRGIEDSSRYWSVAMTLEHLIIVGMAQKYIIQSLAKGQVPSQKASTATVKPAGINPPRAQVQMYRDFINALRPELDPLKDIAETNKLKYAHPWFGKFNMLQWQWMFQAHTHVHRAQIKEIVKGLYLPHEL